MPAIGPIELNDLIVGVPSTGTLIVHDGSDWNTIDPPEQPGLLLADGAGGVGFGRAITVVDGAEPLRVIGPQLGGETPVMEWGYPNSSGDFVPVAQIDASYGMILPAGGLRVNGIIARPDLVVVPSGQVGVGVADPQAQLHVMSAAVNRTSVAVRALAGQTADLFAAESSTGTPLLTVDAAGYLHAARVYLAPNAYIEYNSNTNAIEFVVN